MADSKLKATHLSRSEVDLLVFDKLSVIKGECESLEEYEDGKLGGRDIEDIRKRLKRIGIEADRALALIEAHAVLAKSGHCLHCGKTYAEHDASQTLEPGGPRVRVRDPEAPQCRALAKYFESREVETYQPIVLEVSGG